MANNVFIDSRDILGDNDHLNYINYMTLNNENREYLRTDTFDIEFIVPPSAVYFPGNTFFKGRIRGVNLTVPTGLAEISSVIRQHQIRQKVIQGTTYGTFTIDWIDFEDQGVSAFIEDWRDKMGGRKDRYAFRKEDTIAQCKLTWFNASRLPIRDYHFWAVQPDDGNGTINPQFNSGDPQQAGEFSTTFSFEHFEMNYLNLG